MSNATIHLDSVGRVAVQLQRSVGSILSAADQLGMSPAGLLNGCPHFDRRQQQELREFFTKAPRESKR